MQRSIVDLFEDALHSEDYQFKISFLVGGLVSYESNDTAEKQAQSTEYLEEILNYIKSLNEDDREKSEFIHHITETIERYLNWEP
ncbi:hypothetical protein [Faecalimonas umbilicata]|uniref:hypothetical protein n=1 Tax=Faecalimonas umbilicata TaxID=1912855 RepID=UPI0022E664E2|nr:hypothetical protein [Faecalimonas umbilicata]